MQLNATPAKIGRLSTYGDLKALVRAEGCLNKQALYYAGTTGMPLLSQSQDMDFVRQQVTTSRNVCVPGRMGFVFGGLNLQIEHHLFPTMPRNQLRLAQPMVKVFCAQHGLPYRESGFAQTYLEIFQHMWRISRLVPGSRLLS